MTLDQTTDLVRLIRSLCPAQAIDEHTAEAWQPVLADVTPTNPQPDTQNKSRHLRTNPTTNTTTNKPATISTMDTQWRKGNSMQQ